nr:MAG TPA: hypothetical protein [Caudoviricetes sp.]
MKYKKEDYINAVDDLLNEYDACYFINKYSELDKNTHRTQLSMLFELLKDDEQSMRALNWIKNAYDCYYKEEVKEDDDNAFDYLKEVIEKKFCNE